MGFAQLVARGVAMVGATMILMRRFGAPPSTPAIGLAPDIPAARAQGIPTLKMPTARGWAPGHMPTCAPGLKVNAFATGLNHPRSLEVLPNGDVLTAEAMFVPGGIRTPFDYAIHVTMKRATSFLRDRTSPSAWRISMAPSIWATPMRSWPLTTPRVRPD